MILLTLLMSDIASAQRLLADGVKELSDQIVASATEQQKRRIAVLTFRELGGQETVLGAYLAEALTTQLFRTKGFEIMERSMLDKVLGEMRLASTGVINPATAARIGKVAGVDAIVTGTITDMQSSVAVNCRVIDVATARVFGVADSRIVKDDDLRSVMGRRTGIGDQNPSLTAHSPSNTARSASVPFVNERLRVTVNQLSVAADNSRAVLSLAIENISREPVLLGIEGGYGDPRAALSDDRGTQWWPRDAKGLYVANQMFDLSKVKDADLTSLAPSERVNLILVFVRGGNNDKPGTTFSIAINGLVSVGGGPRRLSIGISGITPAS